MQPPVRRVGVIGLGRMGEIYAANLISDGYQVMVHDRSEAALKRLASAGATVAFKLTSSLFDGKVHKTYGGKIVDERYSPPGMTVPLAVKDVRLALAEAEREAVPMPAASLIHDRLVAMVARGWAALDWSALGLLAASEAGLADKETANQ